LPRNNLGLRGGADGPDLEPLGVGNIQ